MADEDEIDILGDFSLDNLLSKTDSEIYDNAGLGTHNSELNCDCSSQWLLDHHIPTNSTCWYNNGHSDFCSDLSQEQVSSDQDIVEKEENQISTENAITDESGWTKKEKNLLERGIEIFGKSNARLAQFIGTKTATEVKHYLKHFFVDMKQCRSINEAAVLDSSVIEETIVTTDGIDPASDGNEVLDDSEIPASIEEVIAAVSTAKPTIAVNLKKPRKNSGTKQLEMKINYNDIPSGQSVLKSNVYKHLENSIATSYKNRKEALNKSKGISRREKSAASAKNIKRRNTGEVKFKFKTKMKIPEKSKIKAKRKISEKEPVVEISNTVTENVEKQLTIPNLNGEEVVKMQKENAEEESESDIEIDVENINEDNATPANTNDVSNKKVECEVDNTSEVKLQVLPIEQTNDDKQTLNKDVTKKVDNRDLPEYNEEVTKQLMSMNHPTSELVLAHDTISELEKCVHSEFFEGRPTKTPSRYLKIRNHIINAWISSKPLYVTKTSIRPGLKNCGDVNCIGRIHQYLEQTGAINFGCAQTTYIRPLYDLLMANVAPPREKIPKELNLVVPRSISLTRPRIKKKFNNDGEGGCTLTHDEKGDVINTTVVNEEPMIKQRYIKKPSIRLIYCKPFTEDFPQKFDIHLHLSALLLMDLHAHMSLTEVMGLMGGYWNPFKQTLTISRYIPCRNIASSATHCDMCPISQAKAADILHSESLSILGWFHSHPTFAPEPSQQDLDTQLSVQQWIGNNNPCIGLILSPFSAHGALIASPYRCLIVAKKHNFDDQYVPYKFKADLISSSLDVSFLLSQAWRIFNEERKVATSDRVDFNKPYFLEQSITYLDKFISSVKMHLAKCSDVNKMTCDAITQGFSNICYNDL